MTIRLYSSPTICFTFHLCSQQHVPPFSNYPHENVQIISVEKNLLLKMYTQVSCALLNLWWRMKIGVGWQLNVKHTNIDLVTVNYHPYQFPFLLLLVQYWVSGSLAWSQRDILFGTNLLHAMIKGEVVRKSYIYTRD